MLTLTLMVMQRSRINTVTNLAVLVGCHQNERDGFATFLPELAQPEPVRAITDANLQGKRAVGTMSEDERKLFTAVTALLKALGTRDKLAIAAARRGVAEALLIKQAEDKKLGFTPARDDDLDFGRKLLPVFGLKEGQEKEALQRYSGYRRGPRAEADDCWLLSQLISEELQGVRLVLWWSGKEFRPALYCQQPKAALYTFILMKVIAGYGWGVCPSCGQFFIQRRLDQKYCTIAHREAHRVARWRAGKVFRSKKKGYVHGTRKAR